MTNIILYLKVKEYTQICKNIKGRGMFDEPNYIVIFGCFCHILSFIAILYAPVHFLHYTSVTRTD